MNAPHSEHPEALHAAQRAGAAIHDQVAAIIDAAQAQSDSVQRDARDNADRERVAAAEMATAILERIVEIEGQLATLRRAASSEADALRGAIGRMEARASIDEPPPHSLNSVSGSGHLETAGPEKGLPPPSGIAERDESPPAEPAPAPEMDEAPAPAVEPTSEVSAPEPADEEPPYPPASSEDPPEDEPGAVSPEEHEETPAATSEQPPRAEHPAPAAVPEPSQPEMPLDPQAEARRRVQDKDDQELADIYRGAVKAASEAADMGDPGRRSHWEALVNAVISEAAERPTFGEDAAGLGRRRKKKLKPLLEARQAELARRQGF